MQNLDRSRHTTARVLYARWFKSMHFFDFPREMRNMVYSYIICDTRDLGRHGFDVPAKDDQKSDQHIPRFVVSNCPRVRILLLSKQFNAELEKQIRHEGGRHLAIYEDQSVFEYTCERVRPVFTIPNFFLSFGSIEMNLEIMWLIDQDNLQILRVYRPHMLMRLWWLEDILDQMLGVRRCVVNMNMRTYVCQWDATTSVHVFSQPIQPWVKSMELAVARSVSGYTRLPLVTEVRMLAPKHAGGKILLRWTRRKGYDEKELIDWDAARM